MKNEVIYTAVSEEWGIKAEVVKQGLYYAVYVTDTDSGLRAPEPVTRATEHGAKACADQCVR